MDEEIQLINQNTRKEKFKNFILDNKKILIGLFSITILATISIFIFLELKTKNQLKIASKYNEITQLYEKKNSKKVSEDLINIISKKDGKKKDYRGNGSWSAWRSNCNSLC